MKRPNRMFPWSPQQLDRQLRNAIREMWGTRHAQAAKQAASGKKDAGTRGTVTGGKHLDPICRLLTDLVREAGFSSEEIRFKSGVELPGFYRPNKKWDLVVIREKRLCAAIEFKSMSGSYGNNLNNRTEEALGSATDIWAAFKKGTLGLHEPWLGYLFLIRDEPASRSSVRIPRATLKIDPIFSDSSYIDRYGILCERMVLDRVYTASAFLASPLGGSGKYTEPHPGLEFGGFAKSLYGHLIGCV